MKLDIRKALPNLLAAAVVLSGCATQDQKITTTEIGTKQQIELPVKIHRASEAKAPTVILLHGCGGPEYPHMQVWSDALNSWGYNAVVLNSISPRGASQICDRPFSVVTFEQRSVDAFDTAKWVIKQEWATDKVGIVGFSHGAITVLHAAAAKDVERYFGKQIIAAGVAYYPYCPPSLGSDKPVMPVQFHSGGNDTLTPAGLCKDLARNWNLSDQYFTYETATHAFDMPGLHTNSIPDANGKRYWLEYNQGYTNLSMQRTKAFLDSYLK